MDKLQGGFDLDGVLALTQQSLLKELQTRGFYIGRKFEDVRTWEIEKAFPGEITVKNVMDVFHTPKFWERIEACPFLLAGAKNVSEKGVELHIVTARAPNEFIGNVETITRKWLWYNGIVYNKLAFVKASDKHKYCVEKKLDFFIEDRGDTAISISNTLSCCSYLIDTPYNKNTTTYFPLVVRKSRVYFQDFYRKHYGDKNCYTEAKYEARNTASHYE